MQRHDLHTVAQVFGRSFDEFEIGSKRYGPTRLGSCDKFKSRAIHVWQPRQGGQGVVAKMYRQRSFVVKDRAAAGLEIAVLPLEMVS